MVEQETTEDSLETRILVCGDRNWADEKLIYDVLLDEALDAIPVIIEGGARGADTLAKLAAEKLQLKVIEYAARWREFGRAAGPIRNKQMLDEGKPHMVFAFHDDFESSRGTKDMCRRALKAGLAVFLFSHADPIGKRL